MNILWIKLYRKMKDLYIAKEAAKVCELYTDHIDHLIRDQEDATGVLGSMYEYVYISRAFTEMFIELTSVLYIDNTKMSKQLEESALKMITEYMEFATSFENDRIARKVESQLGKKIIIVRSAMSIENFSAHVAPIACDTLVTDSNININK